MTAEQTFLRHLFAHQDDLRAFIGGLVSDPSRREDLFQEVALTLWQTYPRFDARRSFGAWARGIAAKKLLQARRRDAKFPLPFSPEAIEQIIDAYDRTPEPEQGLHEEALDHCLKKLTNTSHSLLEQFYRDGQSCTAMAESTGRTETAIYKQLSRIRQQLGLCIRRYLNQSSS